VFATTSTSAGGRAIIQPKQILQLPDLTEFHLFLTLFMFHMKYDYKLVLFFLSKEKGNLVML
jgi:hypothetical protein